MPNGSPGWDDAGRTVSPSRVLQFADLGGKLLSRVAFLLFIPPAIAGLREAILPEPPTLTHPIWRVTGAERDGGHPAGEPEHHAELGSTCAWNAFSPLRTADSTKVSPRTSINFPSSIAGAKCSNPYQIASTAFSIRRSLIPPIRRPLRRMCGSIVSGSAIAEYEFGSFGIAASVSFRLLVPCHRIAQYLS